MVAPRDSTSVFSKSTQGDSNVLPGVGTTVLKRIDIYIRNSYIFLNFLFFDIWSIYLGLQ